MIDEPLDAKLQRYRVALDLFKERLAEDRYILAAIQVGTLNEETIWRKNGLRLWLIEADGVTKRLRSDGESVDICRTLVENGVNIHAELFPRTRFKQMVEGSSRTAFRHSFYATRKLIYSADPSIAKWFEEANTLAQHDQDKELLVAATWAIWAERSSRKLLTHRDDLELTRQHLLSGAHALAAIHIVMEGQIYEHEIIYHAIELNPELFQTVYLDLLSGKLTKKRCQAGIDAIAQFLDTNAERFLKPMLHWLRKQHRSVPLSELSDHFAHSQLYPWHLEAACEWLEERGRLEKLSAPFVLTKKSRTEFEEPAYLIES